MRVINTSTEEQVKKLYFYEEWLPIPTQNQYDESECVEGINLSVTSFPYPFYPP